MKIPLEILYSILALAGGVAKYLQQYLSEGNFDWKHLLAHAFISVFSGFMFGKFSLLIGVNPEIGFVFAGIGGFMGIRAVEFIENIIKKRLK